MAPDSQHISLAPDRSSLNRVSSNQSPPNGLASTSPPTSSRYTSIHGRHCHSAFMLPSPTSENGVNEGGKKFRANINNDGNAHDCEQQEEIAISSTDKTAGKTISPFLAKHIPNTYNPMNHQQGQAMNEPGSASNTKYCNRHRPDRKCRRQADGPSMEQLQSELSSLSHSDRSAISHVWSVFSAAPAKQRELILQGILSVACFNQLSFISAQVRDLIKIDFISMLPSEISLQILSKLDTISLCKSAQVSRRWRQLADDDMVWLRLCEQHLGSRCRKCGWGLPILERKRLRQEKMQIELRAKGHAVDENRIPGDNIESGSDHATSHKRPREDDPGDVLSDSKRQCSAASDGCENKSLVRRPWKDVYKDRFKVGNNWKHGRYTLRTIKEAHTNGITCLSYGPNCLGENIICSGSYDASVRMFDADSGELLKTFHGATQGIRCLQFNNRQLITGSLDGNVRIYDIQSGDLKKVLTGPAKGVLSVHNDGNYLACGSMDKNIYIWNAATRLQTVIRGHTDFVNSVWVDLPSRTLFSASDDCSIVLWDLDTRRPIKRFEGHVGPVQQVIPMPPEFELDECDLADLRHEYDTDTDAEHEQQRLTPPVSLLNTPIFPEDSNRPNPTPSYILSAGLDATIRLWHVSSSRCVRVFFGHLEGIWSLAADNLRIVSTSEDGSVKIWCPQDGTCERTYTGHAGPVTCVSLSGERLITGGEDCEIRIMTFSD
ncbi:hypothetical protein, variant [Verruconis gallopava]|uniref:F-box domain-containing protein n=1 Tax=Verruconis gallopava TaxID=253628 RepID=A0A0D2ACV1_9PEZI|nr:uncharacterized protein PV09_04472 [Verruconis gallopava]XP_016214613.1 hypothetical protein, variant [Verruconis gallopava]KIW04743.1 hypothetical protein PV09_04472 [Verruconis gallopava]KIW04744.1 hypothetical protein, variant [Verruconis gallopava]